MNSFTFNGQVMRVLDMDAERGGARVYSERTPSFAERAREEASECSLEEKQNLFLTVYSESCITWRATKPEDILRLTLVGQSYICSRHQKKMTQSNALMIFYLKNGKFVPLYELHHLQTKKNYLFLNKEDLTERLRKVFKSVKLSLGRLNSPKLNSIAWQAETEAGKFYIPWHNGCILPAQDYLTFEKKKLEEMRNVYDLLRFAPSGLLSESYYVLCC